jgi:hypothetical protein
MAATMRNAFFWDVTPCGSCRTNVSETRTATIISVTRIGELGTALAVTSNMSSQRASVASYC